MKPHKKEKHMKEFILTQPYNNLEEMINSGEVGVYKEELKEGNIEKYAIVSRIGNRYDLNGKKIEKFVANPFYKNQQTDIEEIAQTDFIETVEEKNTEGENMKYFEIEKMIDAEVEKAVAEVNLQYEQRIEELKEQFNVAIVNAKAEAKAELLAKLNA
jgi:hypothetical protein